MSDPRINFTGQSGQDIDVSYSDMPAGAGLTYVDEFGNQTPSSITLDGSGEAAVPTAGLSPGQYYLSARSGGQELARTVDFYVAGEPDGM